VDSSHQPEGDLTDWAKALQSVVEPTDLIPEGFYTISELGEQLQMSLSTVRRKVYQMKEEGKVEMRKFRRQGPVKIYPANHFKILE
jgi:predicted transcriptional regulator